MKQPQDRRQPDAAGAAAPGGALPVFYVGYQPHAPRALARWLRWRTSLLLGLSAALAVLLATNQRPAAVKTFEWNQPRTFVGRLEGEPVPSLRVRRPGRTDEQPAWSRYLLVAPGKMGAAAEIAPLAGRLVELQGSLIYRDGQTMIELAAGSLRPLADGGQAATGSDRSAGGAAAATRVENLGVHTLAGVIVDSKCFLGVMNPGSTKTHRACAARCIAGGIPPVLLVREPDGRAVYLLLRSAGGGTVNRQVLPLVAEPIEVTGRVERHDNLLVLKANPATYRRLP